MAMDKQEGIRSQPIEGMSLKKNMDEYDRVRPGSNIESELDRLDNAIESVWSQLERCREKIAPILHRHPLPEEEGEMAKKDDGGETDRRSDVHMNLESKADRLFRLSEQLSEMTSRIDL